MGGPKLKVGDLVQRRCVLGVWMLSTYCVAEVDGAQIRVVGWNWGKWQHGDGSWYDCTELRSHPNPDLGAVAAVAAGNAPR